MLVGAFAAVTLVATGVFAGGTLVSGPQVGQKVGTPFNPLNVTGSQAGKKFCQV
jgi:hypothetical protein